MNRRQFIKALAIGAACAAVGRLPKALGDGTAIVDDPTGLGANFMARLRAELEYVRKAEAVMFEKLDPSRAREHAPLRVRWGSGVTHNRA